MPLISFFIQIAKNLNNKDINACKALQLLKGVNIEAINEMQIIPVTETEVIKIITSLKNKNSSGYDGISNKIIKCCANLISKPLTYICNYSLASGVYPERCNYEIVRPVYKKGDKTNLANCRPVSLLVYDLRSSNAE
jgi:hypothetical protein